MSEKLLLNIFAGLKHCYISKDQLQPLGHSEISLSFQFIQLADLHCKDH